MKKGLLFLLGIMSFLGINTVSAEEINSYIFSSYYDNLQYFIEDYNTYKDNIDKLISYWEENYKSDYPYYQITFDLTHYLVDGVHGYISLHSFADNRVHRDSYGKYTLVDTTQLVAKVSYRYTDDTYMNEITVGIDSFYSNDIYYGNRLAFSNNIVLYEDSNIDITIPGYTSSSLNFSHPEILISPGEVYPAILDIYLGNYSFDTELTNYTTINLNDYAYVALSLKDYNTIPESNSSTYTNLYVKGNLCITPVYNYGLTERKDILSGTQVQGCSQYYNDFTLTRMYILKTDVENHAIYYLKAYDTSKDNYVKIDSSKFNITYITEENKDNPEVLIDGKLYPTLSYDSLTDTSTKSEDEGYISGVSCAVGDFNCYSENNTSNMFVDLFDKPLDMLKSVWSAIISIFDLIGQFIALLPPTMQGFLYISFGIAMILGIIKIIL